MSQLKLTEWQLKNDVNSRMCNGCGNSIWYDNTTYRLLTRGINEGIPVYKGTSYKTFKVVNSVTYYIKFCKNCMISKLPLFASKNHSKIFNTLNEYVAYAFNIDIKLINDLNKKRVPTLDNLINKHGIDKGSSMWESYKNKQAISNSFEYKKNKYGWDVDTFNMYNKSRAVTIENLINKYGKDEGTLRWKDYVNIQKLTKSKDYVVDKYGIESWIKLCNSKSNTLKNFVLRYGKDDGPIMYESYIKKFRETALYSSKIATAFFTKLINTNSDVFDNLTIYYAGNSLHEYGKYCSSVGKYYFLDFYIAELNLAIEFNGDFFHANPKIYESDAKLMWFNDLTSSDIHKNDEKKLNAIKNDHDIDVIIVWESDYKENEHETISNIINIIKNLKNK
jgi:hypothetical protein